MKISSKWTDRERIQVASVLLGMIQNDIYTGRYSKPGRPNITSVAHVFHEPPEVLETARDDLEKILGESTR